jgi:hypothetical protein
MFICTKNIRDVSAYIGRDAGKEMIEWATTQTLDDYESAQGDYSEALDLVNNRFVKLHKTKPYELNMARGQDYPKYYIDEGVERYSTEDFRQHDAQKVQDVIRTNENFRGGNKIKTWHVSQHKRHYDRGEHEAGLRDIRELNTLERGYNMDKIYGANPYESSDSIMYH